MPVSLPQHLFVPDKIIFDAITKSNAKAILVGGAAAGKLSHGGGKRDTKVIYYYYFK